MATLVRIDRNGTKYYVGRVACPKCGGSGYLWTNVDGGRCWKCGATGKVTGEWVERTPEYEAKLAERRRVRAEKLEAERLAKLPQIRAEWLAKHGFDAEGNTYVVIGETYARKEELKRLGAKFDYCLGWHLDHEEAGYEFVTVNVNDVADGTDYGYELDNCKKPIVDALKLKALGERGLKKVSAHVGEVGKRLKLKVKYLGSSSWENGFAGKFWANSITNLHRFSDEAGNILVWKTSSYIDADAGTEMMLKGTVKEHGEYRGENQTVMTRCCYEN